MSCPSVVIDIPDDIGTCATSPAKPVPDDDPSCLVTFYKPAHNTRIGLTLVDSKKSTLMHVTEVVEGSEASIAGIADGDVLLAANGQALRSSADVIRIVGGGCGRINLTGLHGMVAHVQKPNTGASLGLTMAAVAPVEVCRMEPYAMDTGLRVGDEILAVDGEMCLDARHAGVLLAEAVGEVAVEVRMPRGKPPRTPTPTRLPTRRVVAPPSTSFDKVQLHKRNMPGDSVMEKDLDCDGSFSY